MAAENIFAQYAQPVRSVADYMGDMDAQDLRRQQLVGAQRQNALAALVAQQQQQTMQDAAAKRNALQAAYQSIPAGADEETRARIFRSNPLTASEGDAVEAAWLKRRETLSKIGKEGADTSKTAFETAEGKRKSAVQQVAGLNSSDEAKTLLADYQSRGELSAPVAKAIGRMIDSDPKWQIKLVLGLNDPKEMLAALQPHMMDAGGSLVNTNALAGPTGQGVATAIPKTQTLESIASNETQRRGQNMTAATAAAQLRQAQAHFEAPTWDATNQVFVDRKGQTVKPGVGPDGQPMPGKPLNDSQAKSYLFGSRMQAADKIIADMAEKGVTRPSNLNAIAGATPLVGGIGDSATNWMNSNEQAQVKQAKLDFMTAALRRESGASIAPSEFETFDRTYFPQIGDKSDQIANKAALRQRAIEGVLIEVPSDKRPKVEQGKPKAAPAATNAKGWALHTDAKGNKAYVSPDGKQYEEVK